jgi:hypothetical protein
MKRALFVLVTLVWVLAACAPDVASTAGDPSLQPVASSTPASSSMTTSAPLARPSPSPSSSLTPAALASPTGGNGATVTGQVILGYGNHLPFSSLPLRLRQKDNQEWDTKTDGHGFFTLSGLPLGRVDIDDDHLSFSVTIDSASQTIDLGKLKYPLIHPPVYYWWKAAPLADPNQVVKAGEVLDFTVCAQDPMWTRPDAASQNEKVSSRPPFDQFDAQKLEKFQLPAVLYDTIDAARQSFPGGLNLDELGTDWLYLTGLWSAAENPISHSACSYAPADLDSLFDRGQLEVWLFGYRTTEVRELDKAQAEVAPGSLCDVKDRLCVERPGYHFAVSVTPSPGFQIIRFEGIQDVLAIHIVHSDTGAEILTLP